MTEYSLERANEIKKRVTALEKELEYWKKLKDVKYIKANYYIYDNGSTASAECSLYLHSNFDEFKLVNIANIERELKELKQEFEEL